MPLASSKRARRADLQNSHYEFATETQRHRGKILESKERNPKMIGDFLLAIVFLFLQSLWLCELSLVSG